MLNLIEFRFERRCDRRLLACGGLLQLPEVQDIMLNQLIIAQVVIESFVVIYVDELELEVHALPSFVGDRNGCGDLFVPNNLVASVSLEVYKVLADFLLEVLAHDVFFFLI